ncbi:hypothetical protein [Dysgonomonas mossii]|uniref:glycosyltransferase family protein n=1 Tax=Dysgonomonas mossii TaxID=163665 RepID=UPI003992693D
MKKRCLLIMPLSFYSMGNQIISGLNECGYDVRICNDRYPDNLFTKVLWKIGITKTLYRKTYNHITRYFLQDERYDICIIMKGYGIDKKLIDEIYKKCSYIVGYNFDSFAFHPLSLSWYRLVDNFYTFDYHDAKSYDVKIIELFSAIEKQEKNIERVYDISVIQKIHSERLSYTNKILHLFQPANSYVYLHESNYVTMALNFIRHPFTYIKLRRYIHLKTLSYDQYVDVLHKSKYTLDFAHPKQSGITMRCFEAVSCGTKIITNNRNIFKSGYFNQENTIVCDNSSVVDNEIIEKYKQMLPSDVIPRRRNIIDFVKEIIQ